MTTTIYCLKCKNKTNATHITQETSKNNRQMLKGICNKCGSRKAVFITMNHKSENIN